MTLRRAIHGALALLAMTASLARAEDASRPANGRQSLDDAWWTGSMLAPSAATLSRGHFLIEPYVFDVIGDGRYDEGGERRTTARSNGFGSLTYMLYGVADRLTVGLIPTAGFNTVSGAPGSSSVGLGDLTLHAEYGLTRFHPGRWVPATAVVVQEGLPDRQVRSARRSPDRRPRHRRAHDDAGVLLADGTSGCRTAASCACASTSPDRFRGA